MHAVCEFVELGSSTESEELRHEQYFHPPWWIYGERQWQLITVVLLLRCLKGEIWVEGTMQPGPYLRGKGGFGLVGSTLSPTPKCWERCYDEMRMESRKCVKLRLRPGLPVLPGPRWGSLQCSPRPLAEFLWWNKWGFLLCTPSLACDRNLW